MTKLSPDLEFQEDWKKFVEGFLPRKFDRFSSDDVRDGPSRDVIKKTVESIEKGDPAIIVDYIQEMSWEWSSDEAWRSYQEAVEEFAKELEDPEDVKRGMESDDIFREIFDEIYEEREEFNYGVFLNFDLLVWNAENQVSLGWIEGAQNEESELAENEALRDFMFLTGLTEGEQWELIANGFDYDVQGFIGEIVNAEDLIHAMLNLPYTTKGRADKIVAFHNGFEGSGYYLPSPNAKVGLDPGKNMEVDFGSYSLGDIFGGVDWTWH